MGKIQIPITNVGGNARVYIKPVAWVKMRQMVDGYNHEVAWLLKAEMNKELNGILIEDIIVIEQICSAAEVTFDKTALRDLSIEIMKQKFVKYPDAAPVQNHQVNGWGHSHVNMGVSPSGRDLKTSTETLYTGTEEWQLMMILNKKGDVNTTLFMYKPYSINVQCSLVMILDDEFDNTFLASTEKYIKKPAEPKVYGGHVKYTELNGDSPFSVKDDPGPDDLFNYERLLFERNNRTMAKAKRIKTTAV